MKPKTLHMIGNAHIDPVWLWRWQEGFQEVKATFRSALDRMQEYDDFIFVASSAAFYAWVEQNDPPMFAEIRQRVAEGRWEMVGGWWIEPDCNIPGGESFVRQALYGQRYFQEKFGVTARVGYNVDSFGHHGMLPQILKKSGLDFYVFMRPSPHEKDLPGHLFWWEADDGSRVLTFRILDAYCTWEWELEPHIRRCAKALAESPLDDLMCFYGVGNHGGGPTKENIETIRRLQAEDELPTLLFSTPERFFESVSRPKPPPEAGVGSRLGQAWGAACRSCTTNCSTTPAAVTPPTPASSAGTAGPSTCCWPPRSGPPSPLDHRPALPHRPGPGLAGRAVQPVPRHPGRHQPRGGLRGRATPVRRGDGHRRARPQRGHPVPGLERPHRAGGRHAAGRRLQPARLGQQGERRSGGQRTARARRAGRRSGASCARPAGPTPGDHGLAPAHGFVADLPALGYRTYRLVHQAPPVHDPAPLQATDLTLENDLFRLRSPRRRGPSGASTTSDTARRCFWGRLPGRS